MVFLVNCIMQSLVFFFVLVNKWFIIVFMIIVKFIVFVIVCIYYFCIDDFFESFVSQGVSVVVDDGYFGLFKNLRFLFFERRIVLIWDE